MYQYVRQGITIQAKDMYVSLEDIDMDNRCIYFEKSSGSMPNLPMLKLYL